MAGRRARDARTARARLLRGVDLEERTVEPAGVRTAVLLRPTDDNIERFERAAGRRP